MNRQLRWLLLFLVGVSAALGQEPPTTLPANLPDALVMNDGSRVTTVEQWQARRRELIAFFTEHVYGAMPPRPAGMRFEVFDEDVHAFNGLATRRQVAIFLNGANDGPRMDLLIYVPNGVKKPPVIFGLNFWGNQTVTSDPAVRITTSYEESKASAPIDLSGVKNNRATETTRGIDARRWPVEEILRHGFAFATVYRGDIDPDIADYWQHGVRWYYPELQKRDDNFSAIGAWAWGLMRGMDYLQIDASIDSKRVTAFGWSRLAKSALWAVAVDDRFAGLISSESGSGGTKLFHHDVGENIERLTKYFPHWYCGNFRKYAGQEQNLPFDMHEVLALVAPRPAYIASSEGSKIFDPPGEFDCLYAAEPVYELLGVTDLPKRMPAINEPAPGMLSYHWRTGTHDVLPFDWQNYLAFCKTRFGHD